MFCVVQLTWVPNELEGFDVAVFEGVERLSEPRGWLYKLWEVVVPGGLLFFYSSQQHWNNSTLQPHIQKWWVMFLTHCQCEALMCMKWNVMCMKYVA